MERYICIHAHCYQPPRENPWLEAIEVQDSAAPYHDWNERIAAECYAPNSVARIMDQEGRIASITNNYARISFNAGPTLLAWLEEHSPETYQAILTADQESQQRFGGHGSAIAQAYNHIIMPLATRRDKITQIHWGVRDFEHRFGRKPEGMWLPELAVDLETLDLMAEHGIRFTILSPHQAQRIRSLEGGDWHEVYGERIDPTMPYLQRLPSGRTIALFFFDGPISHELVHQSLLRNGEQFAHRLISGFNETRHHTQLLHVASEGEIYGHYQRHGDMALAYALHYIEHHSDNIHITNYGEHLERFPPTYEVEIIENTSWNCTKGIERWRSARGTSTGKHPTWSQAWRAPLRAAFDWLRDTLAPRFEQHSKYMFYDPWEARNDYISVILDRSYEHVAAYLARHTTHVLDDAEQVQALNLLELQRQLLLMYTSSGWFFDDLSNSETVQVIQYTGRALQLARTLFNDSTLEEDYLARLEQARSNLTEHRDGRHLYEKLVKPAEIDLHKVAAHYAVSSLFEKYPEETMIYCYAVQEEEYHRFEPGMSKVVLGRARITSVINHESHMLDFCVLHFGDHNVNAGVQDATPGAEYRALVDDVTEATEHGDIAEVVRLLDRYFGGFHYSVHSLFRNAQRTFLDTMLETTLTDDEAIYRQLYERRAPLMQLLSSLKAPLPKTMHATAEFIINGELRRALEELPPDDEQIEMLLERATTWNVYLDNASLSYTFQHTLEQIARQMMRQPDDLDLLEKLHDLVEVTPSFPFEVNFWKIQNAYYEIVTSFYVEMQERADDGEEYARTWTEQFITLGEKLGIRVTEMQHISTAATVASITQEVLSQIHTSHGTYRIQFSPDFTFHHALEIADYLHELGVSKLYSSPIFKPRAGSGHGYDVCDHNEINPALGGEEGFDTLTRALKQHGLSILLDIVPNHMGIGDVCNTWWMDVLENGPSSNYASYFDIEWKPVKPELEGKVLLPTLGDQYGRILESGQLRMVYEDGAFYVDYYELRFPIAPDTYDHILAYSLDGLSETLGSEHEDLHEYLSILTAISYLPPRNETDAEKRAERNREKEVIKRRIASLYQQNPDVAAAIYAAVQTFNGTVGDPSSFDLLDNLLEQQAYRPAFWRVAAEEINYRRFFDINELAAIRPEEDDVFQDTHALIFRLLTESKITGLRIDHIDGLYDPVTYLQKLQERYVFHQVKARLERVRTSMPDDETLAARISARMAALMESRSNPGDDGSAAEASAAVTPWPLYVVAEKILGEDESLPSAWAVHGTSGYDFLSTANNLFVDRRNRAAFDSIYQQFTGRDVPFSQMVNANKKMIMLVSMASEIYALAHQLERIAERNRRYRDFTLDTLTFAIREVIAGLSVYRTYISDPETVTPRDRHYIEAAIADAKRRNPRTAAVVFDFIKETLLLSNLSDFRPDDQEMLTRWVRKFQQVSGPVMAKGVEDTSFYVYNRLVSLNEVGGHPEDFGYTVETFHELNIKNQRSWPLTMLNSSTHDTKRSEDVRARINVLSELPEAWQAALERWHTLNTRHHIEVNGEPAPSRNDEYLLYQTLIGAFPFALLAPGTSNAEEWATFRERITAYMQKATKEAKVHTSWVNPNEAYDQSVSDFVHGVLHEHDNSAFIDDMRRFAQRIASYGIFNSLSQTLLKLTSPGVPDIYQGTELWDFSLVDPDNRRPVAFGQRRDTLQHMKQRIAQEEHDLRAFTSELLEQSHDGRIKLYLIYRTLHFRHTHGHLFTHSSYTPLECSEQYQQHLCAFVRTLADERMLVVVPRLIASLTGETERPPLGHAVWGDAWLLLPDEAAGQRYRHHLTGEVLTVETHNGTTGLPVANILGTFPVGLLYRLPPDA